MNAVIIKNRFWSISGEIQWGEIEENGQIIMVRRDCLTWYRTDNGQAILDKVVYK